MFVTEPPVDFEKFVGLATLQRIVPAVDDSAEPVLATREAALIVPLVEASKSTDAVMPDNIIVPLVEASASVSPPMLRLPAFIVPEVEASQPSEAEIMDAALIVAAVETVRSTLDLGMA